MISEWFFFFDLMVVNLFAAPIIKWNGKEMITNLLNRNYELWFGVWIEK